MHKRIQNILATTLIAFGMAGPTMAQQTATDTTVPIQASSNEYTDTQLQSFISASREVAAISQEYAPRVEATTSQSEREQIFREADDKMVAAVKDEGLTVDEFNNINQQLPQDQDLEERVNKLLQ